MPLRSESGARVSLKQIYQDPIAELGCCLCVAMGLLFIAFSIPGNIDLTQSHVRPTHLWIKFNGASKRFNRPLNLTAAVAEQAEIEMRLSRLRVRFDELFVFEDGALDIVVQREICDFTK